MTAYDLYDAAFDTANDGAEATAEYVTQYADGAFDMYISSENAEMIAAAKRKFDAEGNDSNDFDQIVRLPLSEIEL